MSYDGRERVALRDLWDALEALREQIQVAVEEAARRMPVFAAIMDAMSPEMRAAQEARSAELQREALLKGDVGASFLRLAEMLEHFWRIVEFP